MQVKALKTFSNKKYGVPPTGLVRAGIVITTPDRQAEQWIKLGLVEKYVAPPMVLDEKSKGDAPENKNLGDAPENKSVDEGNENAGGEGQPGTRESDPEAGGRGLRSSALRRAPRSRRKT